MSIPSSSGLLRHCSANMPHFIRDPLGYGFWNGPWIHTNFSTHVSVYVWVPHTYPFLILSLLNTILPSKTT